MNPLLETAVRVVALGAGATLGMDLWALLLRRFGVPSLDFALLGRWVLGLPRGRFIHAQGIAKAPAQAGERALGWGVHYSIGIGFAALLVGLSGPGWLQAPTLAPALGVGLATVVAPLFLLQPALGAGVLSSKTPRPVFNSLKSLATHAVFGLGLYLGALLAAWAFPAGNF